MGRGKKDYEESPQMPIEDVDKTSAIAIGGGGLLGAVAAVAIKKPSTYREAFLRILAACILAITCTGWVCEWLAIPITTYSRVVGIAVCVGFCGWHFLSIVMFVLDAVKDAAEKRGIAFIGDAVAIIRGKTPPPPPEAK